MYVCSFIYIFFRKKKAKDVKLTLNNRIHMDLNYIDPQSRVLNYGLK